MDKLRNSRQLADPDGALLAWVVAHRAASVLSSADISFVRGAAAVAQSRRLTPAQGRRLRAIAQRVGVLPARGGRR
jgi:hypothetical protein